jgi:hypothetical protein
MKIAGLFLFESIKKFRTYLWQLLFFKRINWNGFLFDSENTMYNLTILKKTAVKWLTKINDKEVWRWKKIVRLKIAWHFYMINIDLFFLFKSYVSTIVQLCLVLAPLTIGLASQNIVISSALTRTVDEVDTGKLFVLFLYPLKSWLLQWRLYWQWKSYCVTHIQLPL